MKEVRRAVISKGGNKLKYGHLSPLPLPQIEKFLLNPSPRGSGLGWEFGKPKSGQFVFCWRGGGVRLPLGAD